MNKAISRPSAGRMVLMNLNKTPNMLSVVEQQDESVYDTFKLLNNNIRQSV